MSLVLATAAADLPDTESNARSAPEARSRRTTFRDEVTAVIDYDTRKK